jgi:hypothetical protein
MAILTLLMSTPHFHSLKFLAAHPIHQTNNKNSLEKLTKAFLKQWGIMMDTKSRIVYWKAFTSNFSILSLPIKFRWPSCYVSVDHSKSSFERSWVCGTMSMHVVCVAKNQYAWSCHRAETGHNQTKNRQTKSGQLSPRRG